MSKAAIEWRGDWWGSAVTPMIFMLWDDHGRQRAWASPLGHKWHRIEESVSPHARSIGAADENLTCHEESAGGGTGLHVSTYHRPNGGYMWLFRRNTFLHVSVNEHVVWCGFWHFLHQLRLQHCLKRWLGFKQFKHRPLDWMVAIILSCGSDLKWGQARSGCFLDLHKTQLVTVLEACSYLMMQQLFWLEASWLQWTSCFLDVQSGNSQDGFGNDLSCSVPNPNAEA